jgi:arabinogalactan oligomer/maltooligosaccharide transport system substrate-binding protein
MTRFRFTSISFLIALFSLIAGATAFAEDLVVWHAYRGAEKDAFEKVVAGFNAANAATKFKVTTTAVPYDPFADRITGAVPKGKGPDVFIYAQDRLGGWVEKGIVVPFAADKKTTDRFLPGMMQATTLDGKVYGLPLNFKVITMIYNKKLVATPPQTTAELEAIVKKLNDPKSGQWGLAYWYSNFYYHSMLLNPFVKQSGGGVFDAGRKPTIDTDAARSSMKVLARWMPLLPPEPSAPLVKSLFNSGKVGIIFDGPWFIGEIQGVDFALAPLPKLADAGGVPLRPWITIEGAYISSQCKNTAAATEFIKYLTDTPAATTLAIEGRQAPANKNVWNDPKVSGDPILGGFRKQVSNAVAMPNVPEMTLVWTPVTNAMNTIVKKSATPEEALKTAQQEVEAAIAAKKK